MLQKEEIIEKAKDVKLSLLIDIDKYEGLQDTVGTWRLGPYGIIEGSQRMPEIYYNKNKNSYSIKFCWPGIQEKEKDGEVKSKLEMLTKDMEKTLNDELGDTIKYNIKFSENWRNGWGSGYQIIVKFNY